MLTDADLETLCTALAGPLLQRMQEGEVKAAAALKSAQDAAAGDYAALAARLEAASATERASQAAAEAQARDLAAALQSTEAAIAALAPAPLAHAVLVDEHAATVVKLAAVEAQATALAAALAASDARIHELSAAFAARPAPERGDKGEAGASVSLADLQPAIDAKSAAWALDFERRAQDVFAAAIARMPVPKAGADGFSLDDFDAQLAADGRTVQLSFHAGERVVTRSLLLPVVLDCGVYRPENTYAKGDGVSYGGSYWIAQQATRDTPGEGATNWRLAVRAGRPGRDGKGAKT